LEQGAGQIRAYQPALVHGLLQTAEYAAEIFRGSPDGTSAEKITRLVDVRLKRQRVLESSRDGLRLHLILDEAALRRLVGSRTIMSDQLRHVAGVAQANPNVTVQVIPFDRGGAYEAAGGPFTILDFFASHLSLIHRERRIPKEGSKTASAAEFLDSVDEVDDHSLMFERLSDLALTSKESLTMLRACANEYRG
jgi:hypothetical protein